MADVFSKRKRSQVMATIRSFGNKNTELSLMEILRRHEIKGWRRHLPLIGKPDFAFSKQRVIIFVDGCFWHGCKKHSRLPKSNLEYWQAKLSRNIRRDAAYVLEIPKKVRAAANKISFDLAYFENLCGAIPPARLPKNKSSWPAPKYLDELNKVVFAD